MNFAIQFSWLSKNLYLKYKITICTSLLHQNKHMRWESWRELNEIDNEYYHIPYTIKSM